MTVTPQKGRNRHEGSAPRRLGRTRRWRRPWYAQRLQGLEDAIRKRLGGLSARLGDGDWLDGAFSAGDLLMVTVLRRLHGSGLLEEHPNLSRYVARGEARPAFRRAFDAQRAVFAASKG
ncbi:Glutathione S-transferase, C-terminal domain [Paracoccus aminovorans]|uniref:Glutathione S-transferase, C-terminal domain n=1 Tax=Paracoccus aminovorans TaxID=34004 RepID=A0A1I3EIJ0_9RHOB|nr:glutathione S-transferase I [Paracoccus aminovorans]SFH98660.1 Glutathione S-transferase, C-terminal domain [Paracoccus aminovorans]